MKSVKGISLQIQGVGKFQHFIRGWIFTLKCWNLCVLHIFQQKFHDTLLKWKWQKFQFLMSFSILYF